MSGDGEGADYEEVVETVPTEYLNTDLDLVSREPLAPLAHFLETRAELLSLDLGPDEHWYLVAEAEGSGGQDGEPATDIGKLLDVLEALPEDLVPLLAGCVRRELNLGVACGDTWAHGLTIPAALAARAGALGLAIAFTTYPVGSDGEPDEKESEDAGEES